MAAGDVKRVFVAPATAITMSTLADGAGQESSTVDNSSNGYDYAELEVEITAGAGSDADGWALHLLNVMDGTNVADDESNPIGTGPSPNGATVRRAFTVLNLPRKFQWQIWNDTGNTITGTVDIVYGYYNVEQ